jgi:precorrin-3B synthase
MPSGDGLIVRLRPRGHALSSETASAIAGLAQRFGNGLIDLTRRANLQLRGIDAQALPHLWEELGSIGLLSEAPEAEAVRNVLIGPLAGTDPSELLDPRPLADALDAALTQIPRLWALPGKFAIVIDGGGALPLDEERTDIRLRAVRHYDGTFLAVAVDAEAGPRWLGLAQPKHAADVALKLAHGFLDMRPSTPARMRDLPDAAVAELRSAAGAHLVPADTPPATRPAMRPLGRVNCGDMIATGFAAPFGRLDATTLRHLAEAASRQNIETLRISPWRSLFALAGNDTAATAMLGAATAAGLIVDSRDPLLAIEACPGAPACQSASVDTRMAARQLAPLLRQMGLRSCHVSGCSKGCARSAAADLTLVGAGGSFGIVRYDTARASPHAYVHADQIAELPRLLKPA